MVLDFSQADRLDLVGLQGFPRLILVLLPLGWTRIVFFSILFLCCCFDPFRYRYTTEHQALMIVRAAEWDAVLYDAQWDEELWVVAEKACKSVIKGYRKMYPEYLGRTIH